MLLRINSGKPILNQSNGFTLIEFIFALAISSVLLLVLSSGSLRLFEIYQEGLGIRASQQAVRSLSEELTRITRDGSSAVITGGGASLCVARQPNTFPNGTASAVIYSRINAAGEVNSVTKQNAVATITASPASMTCAASGPVQTMTNEDVSVEWLAFSFRRGGNLIVGGNNDTLSRLINYQIRASSSYGLTAADITGLNTAALQCVPGATYCSVTRVDSSVSLRGEPEGRRE